jgi:hypothetical protein
MNGNSYFVYGLAFISIMFFLCKNNIGSLKEREYFIEKLSVNELQN